MTYKEGRNTEEKEFKNITIINGETRFRISHERGELIVTKINFDDNTLMVLPNVRNQITIK